METNQKFKMLNEKNVEEPAHQTVELKSPQKKLKFLFVSLESLSGDLAWTVKKEGHQIKAYIKERGDIDVYDGIIEKVNDWRAWQDWADVIVFDDVEFGHIADKLRRAGKLVVGGSDYTDKLEMDRGFGQIEMKKYGIPILPHRHFSNYDEAIQFIKSNPDRYVFKTSGNNTSTASGILIVGREDFG